MRRRTMSLKNKYTVLQSLYWMCNCIILGYAAVYLQHKGLSNTWIGIITGVASLLVILAQPLVTWLVEKKQLCTLKQMIQLLMVLVAVFYGIMTFIPMPSAWVKVLYIAVYMTDCCIPALVNAMGMEYVNQGKALDFCLSRGLGSFFWAVYSAILGSLVERFSPDILAYFYIGGVLLLLLNIWGMENPQKQAAVPEPEDSRKRVSFGHVLHSPEFVCILAAFFLINVATQPVVVYMINIIRELGGNEVTLGWANFVLMGVEFPIMMLSGVIMKHINSRRLMLISVLLYVVRAVLYLASRNLVVLFCGLAVQAIGGGLHGTVSVYYINEVMPEEDRVSGQSVYYMLAVVFAGGLGNIIGGRLLDYCGVRGMLIVVVVMSVLGLILALAGMTGKITGKQKRHEVKKHE